jgi:exodeoxyribonuclease VII large subunit
MPVLSITELTQEIKNNLEQGFPSIWIQGEISNFKPHSSGHLYFSLKDKNAQIGAIMFRGHAASLRQLPKDGDQVIVHGAINVYPPQGKYQIVIDTLRPVGVGELLLKLEELKIKLMKKGYFKKEHKKPLPKFPKTIGVITSPTGAVIQDILNVLTRRFSGFHLILNPVRVQGEGAAKEIAQAIKQMNEHKLVDVMIVGRGGGSLEDLWAFNEEIVADAVFESTIPIVCAVGHETDHTIAEYVADIRAPTPSAAAEIVMGEKGHILQQLAKTTVRLDQTLTHLIRQEKHKLDGIKKQPVFSQPYTLLGPWMQRLDLLKLQLDQKIKETLRLKKTLLQGKKVAHESLNPRLQLTHFKQRLESLSKQIGQAQMLLLTKRKERLEKMQEKLSLIDPKNLLKKGYAIVFAKDKVVKSGKDLAAGQMVSITFHDGQAEAEVRTVT